MKTGKIKIINKIVFYIKAMKKHEASKRLIKGRSNVYCGKSWKFAPEKVWTELIK